MTAQIFFEAFRQGSLILSSPHFTMPWSTSLFGCFQGEDLGLNCCVQNCCCQPCVWGDALRRAGVANADAYTVLAVAGGRSLFDEVGSYFARRRLADRFGVQEGEITTAFVVCCCAPFARLQEINTVMSRDPALRYGCATLREDKKKPASGPRAAKMVRFEPKAGRQSARRAPPVPQTSSRPSPRAFR